MTVPFAVMFKRVLRMRSLKYPSRMRAATVEP